MSVRPSAHRQSVDASSFSQESPSYGALRTATASLGLNLDKGSMQTGFQRTGEDKSRLLCCFEASRSEIEGSCSDIFLSCGECLNGQMQAPGPVGPLTDRSIPAQSSMGPCGKEAARWEWGQWLQRGPFCPATHHCR